MVNENQHNINRKCILIQKGYSLPKLSKEIGFTKQAVSQALLGKSTSLRIHRKIAKTLHVSLVEFWPELYGSDWMNKVDSHVNEINEINEAVNS
ncbi:MAG: helix-turn-helix transcriptional regulator [Smithella sp.]